MKYFWQKIGKSKKAFSLAEILIAMSIFTIAAVIASNILIDVVQIQRKTDIQNTIFDDARIIMQQIVNEVKAGTIDYEEYYNINVIQNRPSPSGLYGINYGVYASRFYNPGKRINTQTSRNPDQLGIECSLFKPAPNNNECEIYFTHSADLNTGQNPWTTNVNGANAFCDNAGCCDPAANNGICINGNNITNVQNELYLIDSSGTKKTILGRKLINGNDYALGLVRMEGKDIDQNGFIDVFSCAPEFSCYDDRSNNFSLFVSAIQFPFIQAPNNPQTFFSTNNVVLPQKADLDLPLNIRTTQFIPISPLRANVKDLKFIINPVEDPYKAYGEAAVQTHPSVTIILTLNLSSTAAAQYPGIFDDLTLQTTVSAGVLGKIETYPPAQDVLSNSNTDSWIKEQSVLGGISVNNL